MSYDVLTGWGFTGLRVLGLAPGLENDGHTLHSEMVVIPLAGSCIVDCNPMGRAELAGRADVSAGVTDCVYLPRDTKYQITSAGGGRFALATALEHRITPAGNWSSYPPHKHDSERHGESVLEEIYYFEVADRPVGPGLAYLKAAEVLAEVHAGDVVPIPYGFHGPAMAVPGYDLYYLNIMAGPGRREWLIRDDPAHSWTREQWKR